jgi:hypothetical protein
LVTAFAQEVDDTDPPPQPERLHLCEVPGFIHDSFACRRGKGALAASERLMAFLRGVTRSSLHSRVTISQVSARISSRAPMCGKG